MADQSCNRRRSDAAVVAFEDAGQHQPADPVLAALLRIEALLLRQGRVHERWDSEGLPEARFNAALHGSVFVTVAEAKELLKGRALGSLRSPVAGSSNAPQGSPQAGQCGSAPGTEDPSRGT